MIVVAAAGYESGSPPLGAAESRVGVAGGRAGEVGPDGWPGVEGWGLAEVAAQVCWTRVKLGKGRKPAPASSQSLLSTCAAFLRVLRFRGYCRRV